MLPTAREFFTYNGLLDFCWVGHECGSRVIRFREILVVLKLPKLINEISAALLF